MPRSALSSAEAAVTALTALDMSVQSSLLDPYVLQLQLFHESVLPGSCLISINSM